MMVLLSFPLVFVFLSSLVRADYSDIYDLDAYSSARTCVQSCAYSGSSFGASSFGCSQLYPATCLCDSLVDQSSIINSYIFSCAKASCSNKVEATLATSIWNDYCVTNNALPTGAAATAAPSATTSSFTTAVPAHTTPKQLTATADPSSSALGTAVPAATISTLMLAVICAAIPTVFFSAVSLGLWCFCIRKWRAAAKASPQGSAFSTPQSSPSSQSQTHLYSQPVMQSYPQSPNPPNSELNNTDAAITPLPGRHQSTVSPPYSTSPIKENGGGYYSSGDQNSVRPHPSPIPSYSSLSPDTTKISGGVPIAMPVVLGIQSQERYPIPQPERSFHHPYQPSSRGRNENGNENVHGLAELNNEGGIGGGWVEMP